MEDIVAMLTLDALVQVEIKYKRVVTQTQMKQMLVKQEILRPDMLDLPNTRKST